MQNACIAIIDAAGARLFHYQEADGRVPELREIGDLSNPGRRELPHALFADATGSRAQGGGWGSTDDHRDAHVEHWDREFAKAVIAEVDRVTRDLAVPHVILVASPKMLGELRQHDGVLRRPNVKLDEIARDLLHWSPAEIHDHLASLRVIEPRHRARFAQR